MHPRYPEIRFAIDSQLLILSLMLKFLCADMFPCEDSKIRSVYPYPEKSNHPSFVNISPTVIIDASMERSSQVLQHKKKSISFQKSLNFDLC